VFTARYALSPYIKQIRFVFKGLITTHGMNNVTYKVCIAGMLVLHSKWIFYSSWINQQISRMQECLELIGLTLFLNTALFVVSRSQRLYNTSRGVTNLKRHIKAKQKCCVICVPRMRIILIPSSAKWLLDFKWQLDDIYVLENSPLMLPAGAQLKDNVNNSANSLLSPAHTLCCLTNTAGFVAVSVEALNCGRFA
jgi:hypothetical protein